jgi:RHS repeat-associated protein
MTSRTNSLKSLSETFYYDNLDRLGWVSSGSGSSLNIGYDSKGNLIYKSDAGTLVYDNGSPYQLAHVTPYSSNFPTEDQTIAYTSFGKISTISEGTNNAAFKYNSDKQRVKMAFTTNGPGFWTKYYFGGSYEKVVGAYTTTEYIWIGGDAYNAVAVAKIVDGGTPQVWGIFRDHLGSMTHVKNGSTIYEYSFDAWGRRRDKDNWSYTLSGAPALFANRGFTGHEHLTEFGLINMNGRLYDPLVGRFLSPDNYVQASGFTQSFNRYSYALNNPLTYVDPDGEFVLLAIGIGAAISGTIGYFGGKAAGLTGSDLAFYTMANAFIGGISGGIGASVGAGVSASLSFGGFAGGFVAGAAGGAAGGFVAGTYSTGLNNTMFGTNDNILLGGLKGAGIGALAGGIIGGTVAGIDAVRSDASFWNGRISESGGYNGPGRFLDEEITAGAKPTETGEISTLPSNDDYGKYGMTRSYSNGDAKPHFGVDYGGKVGDNVNAMYDGQVTRVGLGKAYGPNAVRTQSVINGRTYNVDYGHLSKSLVLAGDKVTSGTSVIGYMGRAGIPSYAPTHVHIAVWRPLPNGLMGFVMPHF